MIQVHSEKEIRRKLLLAFGSAVSLCVGGALRFFHPERAEIAACWSLAGSILSVIPILGEVLKSICGSEEEKAKFYVNQFILLAVLACIVSGQYGTGAIVGMILVLGQILEDRSMLGSNEAIKSLLNLSRVHARRLAPGGAEEEIDAALLREGDIIRLRPGDAISADGVVLSGCSSVNQANITGESLPVETSADSPVFAGTTNLTGLLEVRVTSSGSNTVLGRVEKIVEEAQATRAPIMRLTEQYARYYLPIILLLSGFVLFFTRDFQRAISVIIVSVPCAFLLAGPTAMVAALASASRLGILVKSVRFFEAASAIDTAVFDKTGTLTTGRLQVAETMVYAPVEKETLLALAAGIESHSNHPLAQAIVRHASQAGVCIPEASEIAEDHGLGMKGRIGDQTILAGRASWLAGNGVTLPDLGEAPQCSAIFVAAGLQYLGAIYLTDTPRPEAESVRNQLREAGIDRFVMLTGDRFGAAEAIAAKVGVTEFEAECLPEQKKEAIERLKSESRTVLVVGDGVNDAPALAAANLSIAMGALGSDVAIQTADVALMSNDLIRVSQFVHLSTGTLAVINQNMLCGAVFIGLSIVLSSAGYVSPLAACFIHEFGAFFVIFNSARLLRFEGEPNQSS